jgi:hypothetical protein
VEHEEPGNGGNAVSMAYGPAAALELVDALQGEASLPNFHLLLPSVRGEFLARLRSAKEARAEVERGAELAHNARADPGTESGVGSRSRSTPRAFSLVAPLVDPPCALIRMPGH